MIAAAAALGAAFGALTGPAKALAGMFDKMVESSKKLDQAFASISSSSMRRTMDADRQQLGFNREWANAMNPSLERRATMDRGFASREHALQMAQYKRNEPGMERGEIMAGVGKEVTMRTKETWDKMASALTSIKEGIAFITGWDYFIRKIGERVLDENKTKGLQPVSMETQENFYSDPNRQGARNDGTEKGAPRSQGEYGLEGLLPARDTNMADRGKQEDIVRNPAQQEQKKKEQAERDAENQRSHGPMGNSSRTRWRKGKKPGYLSMVLPENAESPWQPTPTASINYGMMMGPHDDSGRPQPAVSPEQAIENHRQRTNPTPAEEEAFVESVRKKSPKIGAALDKAKAHGDAKRAAEKDTPAESAGAEVIPYIQKPNQSAGTININVLDSLQLMNLFEHSWEKIYQLLQRQQAELALVEYSNNMRWEGM
jgi:hypothetical protein